MIRCSWRTAVLLLALLLSVDSVRAAPPASPAFVVSVANAAAPAQSVGVEPGTAASQMTLPERAAPARTLRPYWHVFVGFAIVWLLLFGYVVSLGRRFGRLEREIDSLR